MGLLSTHWELDARLQTDAYVSRGLGLYRVCSHTVSEVTLEDAFTLMVSDVKVGDLLADFALVVPLVD